MLNNRKQPRSGQKAKKVVSIILAAALAVLLIPAVAITADAYSSTTGWASGAGDQLGVGNGLVLEEFYSIGANATYRQKWMGGYSTSLTTNTPAGLETDLWCVEGGVAINPSAYTWSSVNNDRAEYLLWLAEHNFSDPDGKAAVSYILYSSIYPADGANASYGTRVWAHTDFTAAARADANAFNALSTYTNTAGALTAQITSSPPTKGELDNIVVNDAWGNPVSGISYTITADNGNVTFDSTGTSTVTGTTGSSVINGAHPWSTVSTGTEDFTITYSKAAPASTVWYGSSPTYQNFLASGAYSNLTSSASLGNVTSVFLPTGTSQVVSSEILIGEAVSDTFVPAASQGDWWPGILVDYDVTAYYSPTAPVESATIPVGAVVFGSDRVTGEEGVPLTVTLGNADKRGYYVFVWSFDYSSQPAMFQFYYTGADWSDNYGLADEIVTSQGFQPAGTSSVPEKEITVDDELIDNFTTASLVDATNPLTADTWSALPSGDPVPVVYDVDLYFTGDQDPAAAGTLVSSQQVQSTGGEGDNLTVNFGTLSDLGVPTQTGFYYFVWSVDKASQTATSNIYIDGNWEDGHNIAAETLSARPYPVFASVAADIDTAAGKVFTDDLEVSGFNTDHGTFAGGSGFTADVNDITHTLYFFEEGTVVSDANIGLATELGSVTLAAENGSNQDISDLSFTSVKDANGNEVPGTYVFVTSFAGDSRMAPYSSPTTDVNEQYVLSYPDFGVVTNAQVDKTLSVGTTNATFHDNATVTGYVPVGSYTTFNLYYYADINTPICDASTEIGTTDTVNLTAAGEYSSKDYVVATIQEGAYAFLAKTYDTAGNILAQDTCGMTAETITVVSPLADTGVDGQGLMSLSLTSILMLLGGAGVTYGVRRKGLAYIPAH